LRECVNLIKELKIAAYQELLIEYYINEIINNA
ncbi:MAG: hypothetical protein K0Q49_1874, partial [Haloplasmataceae bacterium]|nr:hypothetical protein [Haloplasmataceae bacterium]